MLAAVKHFIYGRSMQREDLKKYDIPDAPGVYFFMRGRNVLYIGKATSLRDRIRSYFSRDLIEARSPLIAAMAEGATGIKWQECGSVLEALILEANLIKKHQPPYNTDEKDDKSFNYLVITKEDFPRILVVRGRELFQKWDSKMIVKTFGPFPQGGSLKEALKIVRKIFPFRDTCTPCRTSDVLHKCKPCFNWQIGLCPGVCSGEVSKAEYASIVKHIATLFSGNFKGLKRQLAAEMKRASATEDFEHAGVLRRQITALEHIRDVSLIKNDMRITTGRGIRIEAYDVAHTGGSETVGVMTVVENGEAEKGAYRKFTIRTVGNDDPAALKEMLARRLEHTEWQLPRLVVVDGGTAQVRTAQKVLSSAGIEIPVVGVVKNEAHKPERLIGDARSAKLYEKEIVLANAEAHRFAIGWHRKRLANRLRS